MILRELIIDLPRDIPKMKDKYWSWVRSIEGMKSFYSVLEITNINSQIAPFSNNLCPLFPIIMKILNGKGKPMFSRSGHFHWELAYNTRPRIVPGPSCSPEGKQSSSRQEVFSPLEDLRKKELWRAEVQSRLDKAIDLLTRKVNKLLRA